MRSFKFFSIIFISIFLIMMLGTAVFYAGGFTRSNNQKKNIEGELTTTLQAEELPNGKTRENILPTEMKKEKVLSLYGKHLSLLNEGAIELVDSRTEYGNYYEHPDGKKVAVISTAPINYWASDGMLKRIDNRIIQLDYNSDYKYRNSANSFSIFFPGKLDWSNNVLYRNKSNYEMKLSSQSELLFVNASGKSEIIATAEKNICEVNENTIIYQDKFPGIDEKFVVSHKGINRSYIINHIPIYADTLTKGDIEFREVITFPLNCVMSVGDTVMYQDFESDKDIHIKDIEGNIFCTFTSPRIREMHREKFAIESKYENKLTYKVSFIDWNVVQISVVVPIALIMEYNSVYPIIIDRGSYFDEIHSYDDCYAWGPSSMRYSDNYLIVGYSSTYGLPYYMSHMTWHNVNILPGSQIDLVQFFWRAYNNYSNTCSFRWQFEAADNAQQCAYNNPSNRSYVNHSIYISPYSSSWTAGNWYGVQDLSASLQDVIDRSGWSSGNNVGMRWCAYSASGGYRYIYSYDYSSSYAPYLYVEYTEGGATDPVFTNINVNGQSVDDGSLVDVTLNVSNGEKFTISATARNDGDASPALYNNISFSVEQFNSSSDKAYIDYSSKSSDLNYNEYFGTDSGGGPDGYYDYIFVESQDTNGWINNESNYLTVSIQPKTYTTYEIYVRTAASSVEDWTSGWTYNPTSGYKDCTGIYAKRIRVRINPPPPDLTGNYFDSQEPLVAGQNIDCAFTVTNYGGAFGNDFDVNFYLSPDSNISTSDHLLKSYKWLGGMQGNVSEAEITQLTLPPAGHGAYVNGNNNYYIGMIIDANNNVTESNENNNRNQGTGVDRDMVYIDNTLGYSVSYGAGISPDNVLLYEDKKISLTVTNTGNIPIPKLGIGVDIHDPTGKKVENTKTNDTDPETGKIGRIDFNYTPIDLAVGASRTFEADYIFGTSVVGDDYAPGTYTFRYYAWSGGMPGDSGAQPIGTLQVENLVISRANYPGKNIPILVYHKVDIDASSEYWVTISNFKRQMGLLKSLGYQSITFSDLRNYSLFGISIPNNPVIISFDDAYENTYTNAKPILDEFGFDAVLSVPTAYIGDTNSSRQDNSWDPPEHNIRPTNMMIWPEIINLKNAGWSIQSHSDTHQHLSALSDSQLRNEIVVSRNKILSKTSVQPLYFCYPFGEYNSRIKQILQEEEYLGGITVDAGIENSSTINMYGVKRLHISKYDDLDSFAQKIGYTGPIVPEIRIDPLTLEFKVQYCEDAQPSSNSLKPENQIKTEYLLQQDAGTMTIECNISSLPIKKGKVNEYDILTLEGGDFDLHGDQIGDPLLPTKIVYILVPPGTTPGGMYVNIKQKRSLKDAYKIFPVQPQLSTMYKSQASDTFIMPLRTDLVNYNQPFPYSPVEYIETANIRGNSILVFRIWPIQYVPYSGEVIVNECFQWIFKPSLGDMSVLQYKKRVPFVEKIISSLVINPEDIKEIAKLAVNNNISPLASDCDYLIITSNTLSSAFQNLADHKISMGLSAEVKTTQSIYSQYSGDDNQEKIKNCILDYATNHGTIWILLGGDDTVLPDRNCYGRALDFDTWREDSTIPTDLYYAGLDNFDWDDDNDGIWGEASGDSVDFYPDVFIGRAPVRSVSNVNAFVSKTISYITTPPSNNFAEKALLCGVELWNTWDSKSDAHWRSEDMWNDCMDPYWDGIHYKFYDTGTDFGGSSYNVTDTHLQEQINNSYGFVFVATHGSQTSWSMETGSFNTSDALGCTNGDSQGIVYTMACNTNAFDLEKYSSDPCLSESFIRNSSGGSVAYIGSSRYGWGNGAASIESGYSFNYARQFFKHLFNEASLQSGIGDDPDPSSYPKYLGAVFASHKIFYVGHSSSEGYYRWLQYSINLMGDPHLMILTEDPSGFIVFNDGTGELNVNSITKQNQSSWISIEPSPPLEIYPSCQQTVNVRVNANGLLPGNYSDRILIYSNDSNESPYPNGVYVELEVSADPVEITNHPDDISVEEGQNAYFEVDASGTPKLHYQWKKNNSNIGDDSPNLTLYNVQLSDNGSEIWCDVSNVLGMVSSSKAILTVTEVNNPPLAVDDIASTDEDNSVLIYVLANDSDPNPGDTLSVESITQGVHGSVVNNSTYVTYSPELNYFGGDSFTYTVSDGKGGTDTANVNITINPINDAPVAVNDMYSVDKGGTLDVNVADGVLGNDTDIENDVLRAILVTNVTHGNLTLNQNGSFTYTNDGSNNTNDTFTYKANDGNDDSNVVSVTIEIKPVSDLVAYYKFDGNFSDSSGYNNNLSNYNGVGFGSGKFNQAANFDGIDDGLGLTELNGMPTIQLSMGGWIKAGMGENSTRIIELGENSNDSTAIAIDSNQAGTLPGFRYWIYVNGSKVERVAATDYDYHDNKWHHVFITYDGTVMKLFVDGQERDSKAVTGTIDSGSELNIGQYDAVDGGTDNTFKGLIDEIKVFKKAISEIDIVEEYLKGSYARRLSWTSGESLNPDLVVNGFDVYVAWSDGTPGNNEIYFKKSSNAGLTWKMKRLTVNSGASLDPVIGVDGQNIYVVWSDNMFGDSEILLKKSSDGGDTWKWSRLTWTKGETVTPSIAVDGSNVYVVWSDSSSGNNEIYLKKSSDGGSSWSLKRLCWTSGNSTNPSISVSGTNIFVGWSDDKLGNREIHIKSSLDGGNNWTVRRLSGNAGESDNPDVEVNGSNVYVVWNDSTSGNKEIYFKKSDDAGISWQMNRLTVNSGESRNPKIKVKNSNVYVSWSDQTPGNGEIFYKKSTDNGVSWFKKRICWNSGNSTDPSLSISGNLVYIIWSDITPGNKEIYYKITY